MSFTAVSSWLWHGTAAVNGLAILDQFTQFAVIPGLKTVEVLRLAS